ncbi:uncharacterized protein LOC110751739 [Prunus avium]|uniref:Uncharacterized protein LOC110751739 n=1 Tax=Prunus avium TaxID=42229 RepID=A0A6P5RZR4_PRUAV|nr:uncharacterized protein LOC110751739 [Prunus avium]
MSTPLKPDAYVLASLMESHFKELDLIPELFLLNKEEMLLILEKCFSHSCLEKALAEQTAVDKSDSADKINPSPVDSALLKDCVEQVRVASNKRFIKIVHCYLLKAGKEKEAQEYLENASPASWVDHLESVKMWNYLTLPFQVLKVMEDMGLCTNPLSFCMPPAPPEVFPTPAPGWSPGKATADGNIPLPCIRGLIDSLDEAGIVPETEDSPSTAVEPNSVGLVLHIGEVTDRSMMDAAAEDKKKKGVMEVESLLAQTKHHTFILLSFSFL